MAATKEKLSLYKLDAKQLGGYSLYLKEVSRGRFIEEKNFSLYLKDKTGRVSLNPIIIGKYFAGRGKWLKPWVDIVYYPKLEFTQTEALDVSREGLDFRLFMKVAELIPSGGRLMVEYSGLEHRETAEGLRLEIPAAVTPLGYLMWECGFRWFKDWYFPEGGMEGGQKLQANKPIDEKHNRERIDATIRELTEFIDNKKDLLEKNIGKSAEQRALSILDKYEMQTR